MEARAINHLRAVKVIKRSHPSHVVRKHVRKRFRCKDVNDWERYIYKKVIREREGRRGGMHGWVGPKKEGRHTKKSVRLGCQG